MLNLRGLQYLLSLLSSSCLPSSLSSQPISLSPIRGRGGGGVPQGRSVGVGGGCSLGSIGVGGGGGWLVGAGGVGEGGTSGAVVPRK